MSGLRCYCIAEALYDTEAVLSNPSAFKAEEIRTLRDQITSNLERTREISGGSEVKLRKNGERGVKTYIGKFKFHVEKQGPWLLITRFYHSQTKA